MVKSFGIVTVAAAGTPVQATDNLDLATGQPAPLQALLFQAHPDNTEVIYVFASMTQPPADHRGDGVGLVAILPAPADATLGPFPSVTFGLPATPNGINLANFWFDAGGASQKVIVSGTVG